MPNGINSQEIASLELPKNTRVFRSEYERLNSSEQMEVQKAFCDRYKISPPAFRARLSGSTRTSDTELAWMEIEVAKYFPVKP